MTATSAVSRGRSRALAQMLDTCSASRTTGETTDPGTGVVTPTLEAMYAGPCKVQTYEAFEQKPEAGGHAYTIQRYTVHVPVGAWAPAVGDLITITAAALDPNLAGNVFRVVALLHKTAATSYRLAVTNEVA